ncbi:hypothetical protein PQR64_15750 [Paraburkholderia phytofirmans]|uniref:hypothetical protein n=1 Tax=Paraburkholderia phytofirmans TaxID=261302 RepID=UPI0038B786D8
MLKKQVIAVNKTPDDFAQIVADADAHCAATANNVVPLKAKKAARPARIPRVTEWTKEVVAERALDLYACESVANMAYGRAIERCEEFKEEYGIDGHVDHKREDFQRYTADTWGAYLTAKDEVKKAKARLITACHNCLHGAPKRERINPKDVEAWKVLYAQIREGTICMKDALAVRDSKGDVFVKSREVFIALQAPDEDSDSIPF